MSPKTFRICIRIIYFIFVYVSCIYDNDIRYTKIYDSCIHDYSPNPVSVMKKLGPGNQEELNISPDESESEE